VVELRELGGGAEVPERDVRESPDALEVGGGLLGDHSGSLGRFPAAQIVELERVNTGDSKVCERQLPRWTFLLEHALGVLEVVQGGAGLVELPAAAAEVDPRPRGLDREPEVVELPDAVREELLGRRDLAVQPAKLSHSGEQQRPLVPVGDVRKHPLEQLRSLGERDGAFGFVGRAQARVDSLVGSAGSQQVVGDRHCASTRPEERIGGARVHPLPLRDDDVAGDRLLRECVPPAVAATRIAAFFKELMRNGGFEGSEHHPLVRLGHLDE